MTSVSRRQFLVNSLLATGGLVLGVSAVGQIAKAQDSDNSDPGGMPDSFQPNAFLRIAPDGRITIVAKHDEMGQGIHTGLAIVICEELEVDTTDVEVVPAPADLAYRHSMYPVQMTGGSSSTWTSFEQMRQAGATARMMLVQAAAARWGVEPSACVAKSGTVAKKDGSASVTYGELAADAAKLAVPAAVDLKSPDRFTRIGKATKRVDSPSKVRGTAKFSLDKRAPGMLTALVLRAPSFGATLIGVDDREARKIDGVRDIVRVPSGVAVIATGYWPAFKARRLLQAEWKSGAGSALDTDQLRADYTALSAKKGLVARATGNAEAAFSAAGATTLESVYEVPFQAHAPMEPMSCMVTLRADGGANLVTGSQLLGVDQPAVAYRLGVSPDKVHIENSLLGGAFGRKANPFSDFVLEAVEVALAARSLKVPIKTVWSREDDVTGGFYRPMFVNRMTAAFKDGKLVGWRHRVVGQSIAQGTAFERMMVHNGIDHTSVEGAADMAYRIPNVNIELHTTTLAVPVQWWRSVGHSNTAFAKEAFLDECAEKLGRDPYELRRELLAGHSRLLGVLDTVAEKSGWKTPPPAGVGRGISVHESFKGFAAHVVEASLGSDGRPTIRRVVCAIDCGLVVNPDQVKAQMQSAAVFALSATLTSGITFRNGKVEQSNFHDFEIMRMHECPEIEVHIVNSGGAMGGVGEVGVPGVASAVCSALYQATGRRIRRLPIADQFKT